MKTRSKPVAGPNPKLLHEQYWYAWSMTLNMRPTPTHPDEFALQQAMIDLAYRCHNLARIISIGETNPRRGKGG